MRFDDPFLVTCSYPFQDAQRQIYREIVFEAYL